MSRKPNTVKPWHDNDVARTLNIANGLLTHVRGMDPKIRPTATTEGYLMQHYNCSRARMRERIADAEDRVRRRKQGYDLAANWLETLRLIGDELSEKLCARTYELAYDLSNRSAFNAQKFLIDKNDSLFAADVENTTRTDGGSEFGLISDIEQEVFDEMTDLEDAQVAELVEADAQIKIKLGHIVRRVRKRLADKRVNDIDTAATTDESDDGSP